MRAGAALTAALAIVGGYIGWRHAETGLTGLTTNGAWNFYGRVAPFADCTRFTPPEGTEVLCDPLPPKQRVGRNVEWYIYIPDSPAQKLFGPPFLVSADPDANEKLRDFSLAAVRGQPVDYLDAVWRDLVRIVSPNRPSDGDLSYDQFIAFLIEGTGNRHNEFVESWRRLYYPDDVYEWGDISALEDYERATRVQGLAMLAVLTLSLAAIWVTPGPARATARLMAATASALMVYPIAAHAYDARFVVPALGPLIAAAALGGWGVSRIAQARLADRRARLKRHATL